MIEQNESATSRSSPVSRPWLNIALSIFYVGLIAVLVFSPGGSVLDHLRWLDSGICAQLLTHSFYPGRERLPLCARNTGIYLGFIMTLMALHLMGRGRSQQLPRWPIIIVLAVGVVALVVDGLNSVAVDLSLPHLYPPHNLIRLATGLVTGLALAVLALPIVNQLFWREYNEERSIPSWKGLLLFVPILAMCFLAVASQSGIVLYPLALLSTIGILTALSSVNLIFIVAISRRHETFERYQQLLPFFSLAFACALGEMLALAQLKLVLFQALGI